MQAGQADLDVPACPLRILRPCIKSRMANKNPPPPYTIKATLSAQPAISCQPLFVETHSMTTQIAAGGRAVNQNAAVTCLNNSTDQSPPE